MVDTLTKQIVEFMEKIRHMHVMLRTYDKTEDDHWIKIANSDVKLQIKIIKITELK